MVGGGLQEQGGWGRGTPASYGPFLSGHTLNSAHPLIRANQSACLGGPVLTPSASRTALKSLPYERGPCGTVGVAVLSAVEVGRGGLSKARPLSRSLEVGAR